MCARLGQRAAYNNRAVAVNDIVVPDIAEATLKMPASDVGHGVIPSLRSSRAMYNDFIDVSHNYWDIR